MISASLCVAIGLAPRAWEEPKMLFSITDPQVNESSGLAVSRIQKGIFYTHNDSGDKPRFFRFDASGKIVGVFTLGGAQAVDWEEMSIQKFGKKSFLYLGDIGDNSRKRPFVTIYRVEEPKGDVAGILPSESFKVRYEDQSRDCEAFFVAPKSGDFWLISKAREGDTFVYRVKNSSKNGTNVAERIAKIPLNTGGMGGNLATGASLSPDGKTILIRTYSGAVEYTVPRKFEDWVKTTPTPVKTAPEVQGEAIAYGSDGKSFFTTSEGTPCPISRSDLK